MHTIEIIITDTLIIFYADVSFLRTADFGISGLLYYPMLVANYLFLLTSCYVLVLHIMYKKTIKQLFKNSFLITILPPLPTLMIITEAGAILFISSYIPWLLFFYGTSLWALLMNTAALAALKKVEKNQKALLEKA